MAYHVISIKTEGNDSPVSEWSMELDHVPLSRRQKKLPFSAPPPPPPDFGAAVMKRENKKLDSKVRNSINDKVTETRKQVDGMELKKGVEVKVEFLENADGSLGDKKCGFDESLDHIVLKERQRMLLSSKTPSLQKPLLEGITSEFNLDNTPNTSLTNTRGFPGSTSLNMGKIKDEAVDYSELQCQYSVVVDNPYNIASVKNEMETADPVYEDEEDHVQSQYLKKLHATGRNFKSLISRGSGVRKNVFSGTNVQGMTEEAPKPIKVIHQRKRKKTATNSVETALEEDAPEILKSLIEQGVDVNEIKLYGETEIDEPIDESFIEDGFEELEAVISKIFSKQSSLLKLAPVRCTKGSKPTYCLACLFALIEQTRYLRFRNWPAEWGWCRDLQSFIFVFQRHNRIVVERPEYGYATYFFELVDSSSVGWQVKRLVTAMKLTNGGRINLIEDKALVVGEDLSEGETKVLIHYGWIPNTSLRTMLNYCDRVYHDSKFEKDTSEWRSKIGNLLKDGFNKGTVVSSIKEMGTSECFHLGNVVDSQKIKVEL